jgi:hypothetical protein
MSENEPPELHTLQEQDRQQEDKAAAELLTQLENFSPFQAEEVGPKSFP